MLKSPGSQPPLLSNRDGGPDQVDMIVETLSPEPVGARAQRATMMSVFIAVVSLGGTVGNSLGGYTLVSAGYRALSILIGGFGLICTLIYALFIRDPHNGA